MRLRKNLPPLTLRLSAAIVNGKTSVSTGFLRFFLVFSGKTRFLADFGVPEVRKAAIDARSKAARFWLFLLAVESSPFLRA